MLFGGTPPVPPPPMATVGAQQEGTGSEGDRRSLPAQEKVGHALAWYCPSGLWQRTACLRTISLDVRQHYSFFSGALHGERAGTGVPMADHAFPSAKATL